MDVGFIKFIEERIKWGKEKFLERNGVSYTKMLETQGAIGVDEDTTKYNRYTKAKRENKHIESQTAPRGSLARTLGQRFATRSRTGLPRHRPSVWLSTALDGVFLSFLNKYSNTRKKQ